MWYLSLSRVWWEREETTVKKKRRRTMCLAITEQTDNELQLLWIFSNKLQFTYILYLIFYYKVTIGIFPFIIISIYYYFHIILIYLIINKLTFTPFRWSGLIKHSQQFYRHSDHGESSLDQETAKKVLRQVKRVQNLSSCKVLVVFFKMFICLMFLFQVEFYFSPQ